MKKIFALCSLILIILSGCYSIPSPSQSEEGYYYRYGDVYVDELGNIIEFDTPIGKISRIKNGPISIKKGNGYFSGKDNNYVLNGTKFEYTRYCLVPHFNNEKQIIYYEDQTVDVNGLKKKYDLNYNIVDDYDGCNIYKDVNGNYIMYSGVKSEYVGYLIGENLNKLINEPIKNRFYNNDYHDGYTVVKDNRLDKEYIFIWNGTSTIVYNLEYQEIVKVDYLCKEYRVSNNRIVFTDDKDNQSVYNLSSKSFKTYANKVVYIHDDTTYIGEDTYLYKNEVNTKLSVRYDSYFQNIIKGPYYDSLGFVINDIVLTDDNYYYRYDLATLKLIDQIEMNQSICLDVLNNKLLEKDLGQNTYIEENNNYYIDIRYINGIRIDNINLFIEGNYDNYFGVPSAYIYLINDKEVKRLGVSIEIAYKYNYYIETEIDGKKRNYTIYNLHGAEIFDIVGYEYYFIKEYLYFKTDVGFEFYNSELEKVGEINTASIDSPIFV